MATVMAAGHTFIDGVCACGRRREHLRGINRSHVNMDGIAHQGALNEREADECIALDAAEARAVEVAMGWIKPQPIRTSEEMDSALRHGSPLRIGDVLVPGMRRTGGWVLRADGAWVRRVPG